MFSKRLKRFVAITTAGRRKWLFLWLIPLAVGIFPFLVLGMIIASRLVGILIGPVNIWNTTRRIPTVDEIAGSYEVSKKSGNRHHLPRLSLAKDHTFVVSDVPAFDLTGRPRDCDYNSGGDWHLYGSYEVTLEMHFQKPKNRVSKTSCEGEDFRAFYVLGHAVPYSIWYGIGDPDNDMGMKFTRTR